MSNVALKDNFLANVKAKCEQENIRQVELARRSKIHPVTINRIFKGLLEPSVSTCEAIAKALGIDPEKIFDRRQKRT